MHIQSLSIPEIRTVYETYMVTDFPDDELKPLSRILSSYEAGSYDCLGLFEEGRLLGYAFSCRLGRNILADYFAVLPSLRGHGIGSCFLHLLLEHYADAATLIAEIEDPAFAACEDDRILQEKRRLFYLKNGFSDSGVPVQTFGVHYLLIAAGSPHDHNSIRAVYDAHYRTMLPPEMYRRNIFYPDQRDTTV